MSSTSCLARLSIATCAVHCYTRAEACPNKRLTTVRWQSANDEDDDNDGNDNGDDEDAATLFEPELHLRRGKA